MVTTGFRRVTPTHVRALTKRYQHVLGELRYHQKISSSPDRLETLQSTVDSLDQALRICAPDIEVAQLQPILFRPPEPIDSLALARAVLGSLRAHPDGISSGQLVGEIIAKYELPCDDAHQGRLAARVRQKLHGLRDKGFVHETKRRWRIT